ncbi:phosphatidylinositol-specific phospholipase C domain-containing protein [Roseateles amylovorans]|uniref:1-phosphatidylinositol phosphodiesterase n=1 Tax=Roseateles amylovorans TaxID=2978473 RepID=A0ABY6B8X0_9BURK|nr:phosphatidylinositol-specific phospholipase C domain-containing protein [Roseateles amylovorans]UXH80361.1 hypothetical protein N4261_10985 [Roseateles amylovorans]
MTAQLSRLIAPSVSALLAVVCTTAKAGPWEYEDAYWPKPLWAGDQMQADWMSTIPDDRPLFKMSIPGTNQSATYGDHTRSLAYQSQSLNLVDQLQAGIRFLDFRCRLTNGSLQFQREELSMRKSCGSGIYDVVSFLKRHPTETVIVSLKQEYSTASSEEFLTAFNRIAADFAPWMWTVDTLAPTLGKVRGKIVILNNYAWDEWDIDKSGIPIRHFNVLNRFENSTKQFPYEQFVATQARLKSFPDPAAYYITNLASSGTYPPYVSAGARTSMFGGHQATFLRVPEWDLAYPELPRDVCAGGTARCIYYMGMNEMAAGVIKKEMPAYVGIVAADFPGKPLIDAIIERNASAWQANGTAQAQELFIYNNPYTKTLDFLVAKRAGRYGYFPIDGKDNGDWVLIGHEFPAKRGAKYWVPNGYSNPGDLYVYRNPYTRTVDYFRAKYGTYYENQHLYLPIDQKSNAYWTSEQ